MRSRAQCCCRFNSRLLAGALVAGLVFFGVGRLSADSAPELSPRLERASAPKALPSPSLELASSSIPEVRLAAIDNDELGRQAGARRDARAGAKPFEIGRVREARVTLEDGAWLDTETESSASRSWAVRVSSPGALHVRLRLEGSIPAGSRLWLRDAEGRVAARFTGPRRFAGVWTPTVFGETARLELDGVAGSNAGTLAVDRVLHGFRALEVSREAAGFCHNDVNCFPEWLASAAAVGLLTGIQDDFAFVCSGQLLNNQKSDLTPLFVTAFHCVHNPDIAATAEVYWYYQSGECDGPPPSLVDVPRSPLAALVAVNPATDFSLLEILGTVPRDLTWLGWTSVKVANGTPATAIHHPTGDFKRVSFGVKNAGAGENCGAASDATHVRIDWVDGPTEPGSSGSAILRANNHQFFGQLHCGPSSCGNETNDSYGSFAVSYPKVKKLLSAGGSDDSSEANDTCKAARLLKKAAFLPERIVKVKDPDWYRIAVPAGKTLKIQLEFAHALGDVDLEGYVACTGEPLVTSIGTDDGEEIAVTNVGSKPANFYWRAFLADDTRNAYNLNVIFE